MSDTVTAPPDPARWRTRRQVARFVIVGLLVSGAAQAAGAYQAIPLAAAFVPFGFALFAIFGVLGDTRVSVRPFALILLAGLVAGTAIGSLALVVIRVVEPGTLAHPGGDVAFARGGESRLTFTMALLALSAAATATTLFQGVRQALRDIIPIDPARFSHAIALAAAVAVTAIPLLPLLVLGTPPLPFPPNTLPPGASVLTPTFTQRSFEMGWFALATVLAAGPGAGRRWRDLRARLELTAPGGLVAVGAVILGVVVAMAVPPALAWLGHRVGATAASVDSLSWMPHGLPWPTLLASSLLTAVGTELTFRGYLQPRLGIVLANLVCVAPLAWMTPLAPLAVFFAVGLAFGALKRYGGTLASLAAHFTFLIAVNGIAA